jgi:ABC-type polysaccharide/polyol phosphate export permease
MKVSRAEWQDVGRSQLASKLVELYRYRELLKNLVVTELKLRYRRSVLGLLWTMLNPLLMMIVLSVVFSTIMRFNVKDYAVLLLSGLLPWTFFAQSVGLALLSVVSKGSLLKKVYIPKALIPLSSVLACLVNFLLSLVPLFALLLVLGRPLSVSLLFLPVPIALLALFTCGVALVFACLNVFFRDFTHMTEVILQAWFYLSPILYTAEMLPPGYRFLIGWNPLAYLIPCFRLPIFEGRLPPLETVAMAGISAFVVAGVGLWGFLRFERHFILWV